MKGEKRRKQGTTVDREEEREGGGERREIQPRRGHETQITGGGKAKGVGYEWAFLSRGSPSMTK